MTVQLEGLVSGDENGPVSTSNPPDMTRFKTVVGQKSSVTAVPFTTTPVTTDANVYMDEFLWTLDQKFSGQGIFSGSAAIPTFVELDNEPEPSRTVRAKVLDESPEDAIPECHNFRPGALRLSGHLQLAG